MQELWDAAGLVSIETTALTVERTFADFEDYWTTVLGSPSAGARLSAMSPEQHRQVQDLIRAELSTDAAGRLVCTGRANAVRGTAPRQD
jgi:hypothetical protein